MKMFIRKEGNGSLGFSKKKPNRRAEAGWLPDPLPVTVQYGTAETADLLPLHTLPREHRVEWDHNLFGHNVCERDFF